VLQVLLHEAGRRAVLIFALHTDPKMNTDVGWFLRLPYCTARRRRACLGGVALWVCAL
jgi:hypothetical protein